MDLCRAGIASRHPHTAPAILLLVFAFMLGCGSTGPDDDPVGFGISGKVLDAEGLPVDDAPIGIIFGAWNPGDPNWPPEETEIMVGYSLQSAYHFVFTIEEPSLVHFSLLDYRGRHVRTLVDKEQLVAGEYSRSWDYTDDHGLPVPNDLYTARLEIRRSGFYDVQLNEGILINRVNDAFGVEIGANTSTNPAGLFYLPFEYLPLGEIHNCYYGEPPCVIPDSLWIQTRVGDEHALVKVCVDSTSAHIPVTLNLRPILVSEAGKSD